MNKKRFTFLAALFIVISVFGQSIEKISYQAVVRDATNATVVNQVVGMKISILQGGTLENPESVAYSETQTPTTNANGLLSIYIGAGSAVTGTFSGITWSNAPHYIKIEIDPSGNNTNYTITGTAQLVSVPYALYAKTAAAGALTGTSLNSTVVGSSLTSVGTLTGLTVTGTTETGFVKITGGTPSLGKVLTSDADGLASWAAVVSVREVDDWFDATTSQTAFTLSQAPSANSKVKMYVNGIRISKTAYTYDSSGTSLTYVPANNGGYALTADDRIQFDYFY